MRVLDLDMDYFMTEIANTPFSCEERLDEEHYGDSVWTEEEVRQFLEQNLGLSKNHKIPGRIVTGHNEALIFWKELINSKMLSDPFDVIHVDSHADLGLGDASWSFLQSEFLTLPIDSRRKISEYEFCNKIKGISIGDYLLWAVAYRMVSSITYCANPNGDKNDYVLDTLKDFHEEYIWDKPVKNFIQLKCNKMMEMPKYDSFDAYKKRYIEGVIKDPVVELLIIPTIEDVKFDGNFDYVVRHNLQITLRQVQISYWIFSESISKKYNQYDSCQFTYTSNKATQGFNQLDTPVFKVKGAFHHSLVQ